tara:strand:+ start:374 stop:589 length:216 start_codon:yes stop_codon:yes gene_type:complete
MRDSLLVGGMPKTAGYSQRVTAAAQATPRQLQQALDRGRIEPSAARLGLARRGDRTPQQMRAAARGRVELP